MTKEQKILNHKKGGFTLIEVAISVALLGLGLTTLVALQTRALSDYSTEKLRTKAALAAQYLMTVWEARNEFQNQGERSGELDAALQQTGYYEGNSAEEKLFNGWKFTRVIGPVDMSRIPLGPLDPNLLKPFFRRIDLTLSSDLPRSPSVSFTYIIRVNNIPSGLSGT